MKFIPVCALRDLWPVKIQNMRLNFLAVLSSVPFNVCSVLIWIFWLSMSATKLMVDWCSFKWRSLIYLTEDEILDPFLISKINKITAMTFYHNKYDSKDDCNEFVEEKISDCSSGYDQILYPVNFVVKSLLLTGCLRVFMD